MGRLVEKNEKTLSRQKERKKRDECECLLCVFVVFHTLSLVPPWLRPLVNEKWFIYPIGETPVKPKRLDAVRQDDENERKNGSENATTHRKIPSSLAD